MFLTKIWSVLVTLVAVAVTAAFLLATPPAESQLQEAYYQQLDGAQGLVDSHLRMESRRRLDFFNTVGKDYKIVKYLKEAKGKDTATAKPIAEALKGYLNAKLKSGKAGKVFSQKYTSVEFVDLDGKVWAQLGENEGRFGNSLRNNPGVKRALEQRVCSDNTMVRNGALYFLWSCPVRYVKDGQKVEHVGAVRAMKKIDDDFVASLLALIGQTDASGNTAKTEAKKSAKGAKKGKKAKGKKSVKAASKIKARKLKVAIAFFMKQKLMARTGESKLWSKVKGVYVKHKKTVDDPQIGRSPAVELTDGGNRYLMVVGRLPGAASGGGNYWAILWRFPSRLGPWAFRSSKLPRSEQFKYLPMSIFVVLGVLALFLTVFLNWFEGDRPIGKLLKQSRELSLGNAEKLDDTQFRGRLGSIARSLNEGLELVADKAPSKPALHDKDLDSILGGPDTSDEDFSLDPDSAEANAKPTGSVLDSLDGSGVPSAAMPALGSGGAPPPPPPPPEDNPMQPTPSGNFAFGVPSGTTPHTSPGQGPDGPPPAPPEPPAAPGGENAAWREVYDQFVVTKKQCGENVDKLTFDAFTAKLDKNKQAVIDKTGCVDVSFRVYIKDGKAALKATPVKA
jgi:hypothetical protein